jgi:endonuclease YncB( thermonuclease family)
MQNQRLAPGDAIAFMPSVRIRLLLTLFLLVLPSWAEDSFTAFVTRVADGDTLTITVDRPQRAFAPLWH